MIHKRDGRMPLSGRTPANAEWRLLERAAEDMRDYLDANDLKLIKDICQKADIERYRQLDSYWGLQSIDPRYQMVGTRDACLYQLSSLLKKTQWTSELSSLQKDNATKLFLEYERKMLAYNRDGYRALSWSDDPKVQTWLARMQHFIQKVLGPLDMGKVLRYATPGPGGTFGLSSQMGHRYYKYASIPYEITSDCISHARRLIKSDERWMRAIYEHPPGGVPLERGELPADNVLFRVVPGNRIEFVPKKHNIARTIGLEPSMNVMLQLGVDGYVRKRLLKVGININDQEINKSLARIGSIDNSLDTLDLAGASDTISMRLIDKLLPTEWVMYLSQLRSDQGSLPDGSVVNYQKLSSMGNGYTFAIETLVFSACVYAVNPEVKFGTDAHVYGDDIIVPHSTTADLIQLLGLCGFEVNTEKSFTEETFTRESCGADFYRGENIRPIFLKQSFPNLDVFAFYSFHNRLKEWFSRVLYINDPSCAAMLDAWCAPKWQLYGPPDLENQSSYLAVSEPRYGCTSTGAYIHDQAIAVVNVYQSEKDDPYFQLLCHSLVPKSERSDRYLDERGVKLRDAAGSQFDITRRGSYKIRAKRRASYTLVWPAHHHSL
uniref:RNA-directed RNA polymerase n=1 Tax=de Gerlache virus TaxID=2707285 RepID=A0A6H0DKB0_9VIRU|nr:MAG: RNA-dependent RNA polymerase [de Gerlache virus]